MRLLNVQTLKLSTFYDYNIPPYAILSHTWLSDTEEVTFAHLNSDQPDSSWLQLPGAKKILYLCKQAAVDGYGYVWADTCCIDKSSSTELNEAINSMFKWYQNSQTCYAYLSDIGHETAGIFTSSRWWTRSWTLQELLAPESLMFYGREWEQLGTKAELATVISAHSGIDLETIRDPFNMHVQSIATRMSWASDRTATRSEDLAYSLLGIFDVSLSMQYGEGSHAFLRLQEKLLSTTNDQSLFAWGYQPYTIEAIAKQHVLEAATSSEIYSAAHLPNWHEEGVFAENPARFDRCKDIVFYDQHAPQSHIAKLNGAFSMELAYCSLDAPHLKSIKHKCGISPFSMNFYVALLPCGSLEDPNHLIGMLLEMWTEKRYRRAEIAPDIFTFLVPTHLIEDVKSQRFHIDDARWIARHQHGLEKKTFFHQSIHVINKLPADRYRIHMMDKAFVSYSETVHLQHGKNSLPKTFSITIDAHLTQYRYLAKFKFMGDMKDANKSGNTGDYEIELHRAAHEYGQWSEVAASSANSTGIYVHYDGLRVAISSQWVYNHLLSTLTIREAVFL